ncbi:hypothetical protein M9H77_07778 [Catharanthus roseus]|uniref:Uncharacterized protein n=1 Tax=Catharanthus roseus TaxID=4058 RepID=A0ACC0BWB6_CATRO|nr:hypothetical protein M9H77_07778 [Catharanthus roseus]
MFSSQISLEWSRVPRATEVLGQEFLDQISPEGRRFMFYLFRLESSVEFLFMSLYIVASTRNPDQRSDHVYSFLRIVVSQLPKTLSMENFRAYHARLYLRIVGN